MSCLAGRYRRWFEYEMDSHARVLASLRSVPAVNRESPAFRKATTLVAHLVAARELWLFRLGAAAEAPRDFFPDGVTLDELTGRLRNLDTTWTAYLAALDDQALARICEYRSLEGQRFKNCVEDILTQLFGHSWYHRGQIATQVRAAGGEPAATDFIFRTRELIDSPDVETA